MMIQPGLLTVLPGRRAKDVGMTNQKAGFDFLAFRDAFECKDAER
jgi:hypothetical protein